MTRGELVGEVRELYQNEKFRMDAYFFCGFPSGTPNEKLVKACEGYLDALDSGGEKVEDAAGKLIAELEAAASAIPKITGVNDMIKTQSNILEILEHKELLV